jgi:Protein of unknown function (DUF2808)
MHKQIWLNLLVSIGLVLLSPAVIAIESRPSESKSFDTALKLTRAYAIYDTVNYYPASYQFTIQIPRAIKQSLAQLTLDIPEDNAAFGMELPEPKNILVFNPTDPESLLPHYPAQKIPARITLQKRTIVLDFEPPLSPDQTFTIEFTKMRNPEQAGTYLLEVHAIPAGENMVKQFLGYGRLFFRDVAAD